MKKSIVNKLVVLMPLILVSNFVSAQWWTGGNFVSPGDFLGSTNTMPIDFRTDNLFRLRVNPIGLTNINGSMVQTDGYVGINTTEPRSYLHINGPNNTPGWSAAGYRRWMQTGVFNMENSDNLYTGLMTMDFNRSDAVWVWGDDNIGAPTNYSRFIFAGVAGVDGSCTDCPTNSTGREGREVMRLAPNGRVGVGPLFETNIGGINSNIHNHMEGTLPVWFQQSNETGTGGLATDGLRIGITSNSNAYMFNQENNPLIFSTGNTTNQLTRERFRITHIGVPGMPNNGGYPVNFTRIGISLNPLSPVSQPRTLIHMGANVAEIGPSTQGWRPWMNTGVYMNEQLDNMYVGLKFEGTQRADAVVAWGANQTVEDGQDNLRFIFARSALSGGGDAESVSNDGLEVGRFAPTGNFGIGNFYTNGLSEQPTQKLDVDGTARLRQMPNNVPQTLITGVEIDTIGDYVLNHLEFNNNPNSFLAGNGTWQAGTNVCDWSITGQNLSTGHAGSCLTGNVGVGRFASNTVKLDALVGVPNAIGSNSDICAIRGINNADGSVNNGILAVAGQLNQSESVVINRGGYFIAANARESGKNFGVYSVANDLNSWGYSRYSYGLLTYSARADTVFGVYARASRGRILNIGCVGTAEAPLSTCELNVGVYGSADGNNSGINNNIGTLGYAFNGNRNYGVYGQAPKGHWAGYFAGDVEVNGTIYMISDEMFKTNVEELSGGLDIINQLSPKTYNFIEDQVPGMNLPAEMQYGLIAQEIAEVVPDLVGFAASPTIIDSLGNEISSTVEYNAVNYIGFVPILISAIKEQQTQIATQDESIAQLQESLNNQNEALAQMMEQLANMQQQINQCCNAHDGSKSVPGGSFQPQDLNNQKSIDGGNELYQNIPNPFRESTTISYMLEEGGRVQLSVYDANGKVITTLVDARQDSGRHSTVWNANGMPSGVYHYALYVDGELLVKRAIKLQE